MERDIEAIKGLSLQSVKRYLRFTGWSRARILGGGLELYVLSDKDQPPIEVVLPEGPSPESVRRLTFALRSLSQLHGMDMPELIASVQSLGFDTIKPKLPDHLVRNDSIALEVAADLISKLKRVMETSATTELGREPHFGRIRKEAQDYAQRCRFGHTFRGSFGFVIESPVEQNNAPTIDGIDQEPPFERKVIQRIVRGLKAVVAAQVADDPTMLVQGYGSGLNANMADELADIIEITGGATVTFGITLSPEWRSPPDLQPHSLVEIGSASIDVMREAARRLRQQEIDRNRIVTGRITKLKSEENPSDLLQAGGGREVVVKWRSPDMGDLNVKVILPPQEYLAAVEAHKEGHTVSLRGVLDKVGRSWELRDPHEFAVLP